MKTKFSIRIIIVFLFYACILCVDCIFLYKSFNPSTEDFKLNFYFISFVFLLLFLNLVLPYILFKNINNIYLLEHHIVCKKLFCKQHTYLYQDIKFEEKEEFSRSGHKAFISIITKDNNYKVSSFYLRNYAAFKLVLENRIAVHLDNKQY